MREETNIMEMLKDSHPYTIDDIFVKERFSDVTENKFWMMIFRSRLFRWFMKENGKILKNGVIRMTFNNIKGFPVPDVYDVKFSGGLLERLADMLSYLHDKNNADILSYMSNERIASYIKEIADMVIYELYFSEHMRERGIDVIYDLKKYDWSDEVSGTEIERFFMWFQQSDNMVRQKIMLLDTRSHEIIYKIHLEGNV